MATPLRLLIIEDSSDDALLMVRHLRHSGYDLEYQQVDSAEALIAALAAHEWDVILSDYSLPGFGALPALRMIREWGIDIPFIIVSGTVGEDIAVIAMKAGAHDFFSKANLARLVPAIERELREAGERRQRRLAELQLAQAEQRFATAFQASPVGIAVTSAQGDVLDVNRRFLQLLGYERGEAVGRALIDLLRPAEESDRLALRQVIAEQTSIQDIEIPCRTQAAAMRHLLVSMVPIDLGGERGMLSLFHDVTERKQAQDELVALYNAISYLLNADSLASLGRQIVEAVVNEFGKADCGLVLVDADQHRLLEFARSGAHPATTGEPSTSLDRLGLVTTAIRTGAIVYAPDVGADPRYWSTDARTRSELVIPLRTATSVLGALDLQSQELNAFDERDQRILAAFVERAAAALESMQLYEKINRHAAELEQRVEARTAQLQRAKEHVEALLDNISDMIIVVAADGAIQQTNPAFENAFAYANQTAYGRPLLSVIEPDAPELLIQAIQRVALRRQPERLELTCHRRDGSLVSLDAALASATHDPSDDGDILISLRDITERQRLESGLRTALARERELNELKSRFVSMVSHEFRTPLASILSSSELLSRYADRMAEERKQEHLQQIFVQVRHLTDLLDDVLTIGRSDLIALRIDAEMVNVDQFFRDLVEEMQALSRTHPINVAVHGDCIEARIDPKLMRQVVTNLLSNAFKYSPEGSPVEFGLHCEQTRFVLYVKDNGIGIPSEDQPYLFEIFHRGRNVGATPGTGLGLAIIKRAVEAHHGRIEVQSEVGKGTTFVVSIPLSGTSPSAG